MCKLNIIILSVLACAICATADGHGKGHGKGHHGGMMFNFFGLGDEGRTKFCSDINNDKIEQMRTEMAACYKGPCCDQGDDVDVSAITGFENQKLVKMECSTKMRACMKEQWEKHRPKRDAEEGEGGEGEGGEHGDNEEMKKKHEEIKVCSNFYF